MRGGATDQGTEAGVGNNTVRILTNMSTKHDDGSDMEFMYPRTLPMTGHLHMIYNASEESFGKSEWGKQCMNNLRVIENFAVSYTS